MLFRFLAVALAVAARVSASQFSGPYEALTFYYAYQMEYDAFPTDDDEESRYIGYGCTNRYGRKCNFNEFLSYVYKDGLGGYGVDPKNNGPFNPDDTSRYPSGPGDRDTFNRMATDLAEEGFVSVHYNPYQLFYGGNDRVNYKKMLNGIGNRVEAARQAGVTTYLDAVKNGFFGIHGERVADDFPSSIEDIRNHVQTSTGITVDLDPNARSPAGRTYTDIDWAGTAGKFFRTGDSPEQIADKLNMVSDAVRDYDGNDFHYGNIMASKEQLARVNSPCPAP